MFKFGFDIDDVDEEISSFVEETQDRTSDQAAAPEQKTCGLLSLEKILDSLPSKISYSPLYISSSRDGQQKLTLVRRDLFDARFQVISQAESESSSEDQMAFFDAPSDLVPNVYEGGLKTWECSVDLAEYLHDTAQSQLGIRDQTKDLSILELGCGTAIPSLYLMQQIFSSPQPTSLRETHIHLQDYNASVLELVTLANVFLTWYFSPASATYQNSLPPEERPELNPELPEELEITSEMKSAFLSSLQSYGIHLALFAGSWDSFLSVPEIRPQYDIILSSETIYRADSLPSLVNLLHRCYHPQSEAGTTVSLCLIAAKLVYFGVGGGAEEFVKHVEGLHSGKVQKVWDNKTGIARGIMSVSWA